MSVQELTTDQRIRLEMAGIDPARAFPRVVMIEITNDCNLRCYMCGRTYWGDDPGARIYMEDNLVYKLLDEIAGHQVGGLCLFGNGEPLLHPRFLEYLQHARAKKINNISINTNAHLLSEELSAGMLEAGLDFITFSIDALHPATYRRIRRSELEGPVRNVHRFLEIRRSMGAISPGVSLQLVPMKVNRREIVDYVKYWIDYLEPTDQIHLHQICPFEPGERKDKHLKIGVFGEDLEDLKRQVSVALVGRNASSTPMVFVDDYLTQPRFFPCQTVWMNFYVPAGGIVKPCWCSPSSLARIADLDLRSMTIEEVFNGELFTNMKLGQLNASPLNDEGNHVCRKCGQWNRPLTMASPYEAGFFYGEDGQSLRELTILKMDEFAYRALAYADEQTRSRMYELWRLRRNKREAYGDLRYSYERLAALHEDLRDKHRRLRAEQEELGRQHQRLIDRIVAIMARPFVKPLYKLYRKITAE